MFSTEDMQKASCFLSSRYPYTFQLLLEVTGHFPHLQMELGDRIKFFCAHWLTRGKAAKPDIESLRFYRKKLPFFAVRSQVVYRTLIQYPNRKQNAS